MEYYSDYSQDEDLETDVEETITEEDELEFFCDTYEESIKKQFVFKCPEAEYVFKHVDGITLYSVLEHLDEVPKKNVFGNVGAKKIHHDLNLEDYEIILGWCYKSPLLAFEFRRRLLNILDRRNLLILRR